MTACKGTAARTFIFADVLESKGIAGILAFDDADFCQRRPCQPHEGVGNGSGSLDFVLSRQKGG